MNASQDKDKKDPQRDAGLAAEQRPVPSQAEGDEETVDRDLEQKQGSQKR